MSANIEWARPEVTECYSYYGRLYRSEKKAKLERDASVKYYDNLIASKPDHKNIEWWKDSRYNISQRPIYKITWTWEEVNG